MSKLEELKNYQLWCDNCLGDGMSWLTGKNGIQWAVKDINKVNDRWLCSMCRTYPGHSIKAKPRTRFYRAA